MKKILLVLFLLLSVVVVSEEKKDTFNPSNYIVCIDPGHQTKGNNKKQMKINVFEQIDKKIANNITSNYNDVEYFNIQSEENQYHYGILTL